MNEDKMHGLNGYVHTFTNSQRHSQKYVLIYARDSLAARSMMFKLHGDKWGFQYSLEQWKEYENDPNRLWTMETMLGGPIYCRDIEEADVNER